MLNLKRVYREYLNTVKGDIEVQMRSQKRVASGDALRSLRVVANQFLTAEIRGVKYLTYLEDGVGSQPSKFGRGLIANIAQWMTDKGVSPRRRGKVVPRTETNIRRSAGGIARDIVRRGTAIKRGEQGLQIQEAINENMPELLKDVGTELVKETKEIFKLRKR